MTMSIRRMSLGSGFRYLMSSVAQSDGAGLHASALTRYYAETGTPPGRFLGAGLAGLADGAGVPAGTQVGEEHLFRMLGQLRDPVTGTQLGAPPRIFARKNGDQAAGGILTESLTGILTGPTSDHSERLTRPKTPQTSAQSRLPQPVAGFDLTFSAPKSVSVAWALADSQTQARIYEAHQRALNHVIHYAEQHVFSSRSGRNGVVQEDIRGVVAAAFDHWDSRSGDPQLHTHVVIMNRVHCDSDGVWRALDSRGLFKSTVALSAMYNGVLSDYLTEALGYGWQPVGRKHSTTPKWEIAGVPERLQAEFSQRSVGIEDTTNRLVTEFATAHGRSPSGREVLRLRQQATLATRPDKHVQPLTDLVAGWRGRAAPILSTNPSSWVGTLADGNDLPFLRCSDLSNEMLDEVARVAVDTVAGKRATFTRSNVFAEVLRQLHGVRFVTADDRIRVAERTTTLALTQTLLVSPPDLTHTPAAFRRQDGTSRFRARTTRFTPPRLCWTPKPASSTPDGPLTVPGSAHASSPASPAPLTIRISGCRVSSGSPSNGSPLPGGSSTSWWVRPGPESPPPWRACAPPGNTSMAPGRSSGSRRRQQRRRYWPTRSGSRRRTPPNGSPKTAATPNA
jgi:conjugative relaxase-like TrwC/TraI family protein